MTVFRGAVDTTFAAFGIDAVYTPAGGEPVSVRVIVRRPDTIVGFGETRIHAETASFEVQTSEVASPRPGDQFMVGDEHMSFRASPSGGTLTGSCGFWMCGRRERLGAQVSLLGRCRTNSATAATTPTSSRIR
jgi:hypothetical protein